MSGNVNERGRSESDQQESPLCFNVFSSHNNTTTNDNNNNNKCI